MGTRTMTSGRIEDFDPVDGDTCDEPGCLEVATFFDLNKDEIICHVHAVERNQQYEEDGP